MRFTKSKISLVALATAGVAVWLTQSCGKSSSDDTAEKADETKQEETTVTAGNLAVSFPAGSLPEGVRLATHCMGLVPAATYRRALECLVTFDRRANLPNIHVPTLLVAGEHDRNAPPAVMKKMGERIANSTFIEMKGIGHLQNLEAPEEFDGLLLNFLALPDRLLH